MVHPDPGHPVGFGKIVDDDDDVRHHLRRRCANLVANFHRRFHPLFEVDEVEVCHCLNLPPLLCVAGCRHVVVDCHVVVDRSFRFPLLGDPKKMDDSDRRYPVVARLVLLAAQLSHMSCGLKDDRDDCN